jgi:cation:H+ antiporter
MLNQSLVLIFGVILAVLSAKYLVSGAITIAKKFSIPEFVIGTFIIGFGTSLPEFTVNIQAALSQNTELAISNVLGSNLFNTCITLGLVGLSGKLLISKDVKIKDTPYNLIAAIMIAVCGNQLFFDHIEYHQLMMSHAIIFLCFFAIYIYYTMLEVEGGSEHKIPLHSQHQKDIKNTIHIKAIIPFIQVVFGLIGLVFGGELIVKSAEQIAMLMGLSSKLVGLLIVGPGTSIPELIASIAALRAKSTALILGNVFGSNIFNIFFTLGITAMIQPVPLDTSLNQAVLFNILAAAFLTLTFWFSKAKSLSRLTAGFLIIIYTGYLYLAIIG